MLDVLVAKVVLDCPGVVPPVRQVETTGMAQHVGVDREIKVSLPPRPGDQLTYRGIRHWSLSFGDEHVLHRQVVPFQPVQCPDLLATQGGVLGVPFSGIIWLLRGKSSYVFVCLLS